ncbi:MAG: PAS domain S-box protein [Chloracidobacterium sp.]|nr:PAS domain S-box protein [Chloracidobacterium sp.]MCO5334261.1 PAS domain S-box protein [Pyrinomonadaceae bacterium]
MDKIEKRSHSTTIPGKRPEEPPVPAEAMYESFIENLPVMFYAVTPKPPHRAIYMSPNFEEFGYPIEDWLTQPDIWDRVMHPDDREHVLGKTRSAMKRGRDVDFEYRIVCKNGDIRWIRDRSCFIRDKNGKRICWQGVVVDITERRLAEQKIERRELLYRTLAHNIPQAAVLLFDKDHRYLLAEGSQLLKHKLNGKKIEGKTLNEVFDKGVTEEWAALYDRTLAGESINLEKATDDAVYQIDLLPVRDDAGNVFAGMVMWQDISERKNAEEALRKSEAQYRDLFDNASDIIYVNDLDGFLLSINKAAERIFGYTREEALKLNIAQIAAPEHVNRARAALARKVRGDATQTIYELECLSKTGQRIVLEVNSSVILDNGEPVAIQGVARDITERKQAETAIRRSMEETRRAAEAARNSEARFRELFENANDLIYTHDLDGNFTSLNRAGEMITGYSRAEALEMNLSDLVAPEFLETARTMSSKKAESDTAHSYEIEIIARDGRRVVLDLSTRLIVANGRPVGVQGIGRDITEKRAVRNSLRDTLSLFETTFESTADGIVVMSLDRNIVTCNKKFVEMWQVDPEIIKSKNGDALVAHIVSNLIDGESFLRDLDETYKDPNSAVSELLELTNGRIFERYSQPQYLDGKPIGRVACFRDITERSRAEERLRHVALHDTLTNLPNRAEFMNHLQAAIDRTRGNDYAKFAVLFLDLDRFKVINDSLGHAVGDKLLVAIAERLQAGVRPGDIVARLGGDEFTILLNRSGVAEDVAGVAERLQRMISAPFKIDNYEVFTSASIGIVASGTLDRQAEDFLRDADAAMYRAKEAGKARYEVFDQEMHVRNMNLLRIETDLRHAVDRNEFEVHYQPIVDLKNGTVSDFEALLRWRHPELGLITPTRFVHVAEETGLIVPIGKWILTEACRQIAEWRNKFGRKFAVSVNLSAKQLMHPTLTADIDQVLVTTGLDADQLKLEVTESTVMEHSEKALKVLTELDSLGIDLSTDDFGTGYSSLSYLQKFPFERLKIDRSFINLMVKDTKSAAIVKTILMLGENLGISAVAEGVETVPQFEELRRLGCKLGQGYLFSPPVRVNEAESILAKGRDAFPIFHRRVLALSASPIELAEVQ